MMENSHRGSGSSGGNLGNNRGRSDQGPRPPGSTVHFASTPNAEATISRSANPDFNPNAVANFAAQGDEAWVLAAMAGPEIPLQTGSESVDTDIDLEVTCNPRALNATTEREFDTIFHDSGATRHIFHDKTLFHTYETLSRPVRVSGFGSKLSAEAPAKGSIKFSANINGETKVLTMTDVLHVPTARVNLVSQSQMDLKGVEAYLGQGKVVLYKNKTAFARGTLIDGLYRLDIDPIPSSLTDRIAKPTSLVERMGDSANAAGSPMEMAMSVFNKAGGEKGGFYTAL